MKLYEIHMLSKQSFNSKVLLNTLFNDYKNKNICVRSLYIIDIYYRSLYIYICVDWKRSNNSIELAHIKLSYI